MQKTQLTALVNSVITRYTPSVYNNVTSAQTKDIVELKTIAAGSKLYADQILTSDITSPELEYKLGSDYFICYASHFTVAIVQELKLYVFTETAVPTNSYIIAALNQTAAETIAANAGKTGSITATLPDSYFGTAGIITSAV